MECVGSVTNVHMQRLVPLTEPARLERGRVFVHVVIDRPHFGFARTGLADIETVVFSHVHFALDWREGQDVAPREPLFHLAEYEQAQCVYYTLGQHATTQTAAAQ